MAKAEEGEDKTVSCSSSAPAPAGAKQSVWPARRCPPSSTLILPYVQPGTTGLVTVHCPGRWSCCPRPSTYCHLHLLLCPHSAPTCTCTTTATTITYSRRTQSIPPSLSAPLASRLHHTVGRFSAVPPCLRLTASQTEEDDEEEESSLEASLLLDTLTQSQVWPFLRLRSL